MNNALFSLLKGNGLGPAVYSRVPISLNFNTHSKYIFSTGNRSKSTTPSPSQSDSVQNRNMGQGGLDPDYLKYFKFKRDLMSSFRQGYVKRVKLTGNTYNNYSKFKLRKFA